MDKVATIGGFLAILTFIHFAVDWICQTHDEAMNKHNNWRVRANHCMIYTLPFIMFLSWYGLSAPVVCLAALLLFFSHFVEDTYLPVFYWAKYIRKPIEMRTKIYFRNKPEKLAMTYLGKECNMVLGDVHYMIDNVPQFEEGICYNFQDNLIDLKTANARLVEEGFKKFVGTAMGKILLIGVDQIIHLIFLLPIAYMLAYK